jgi:hypothetical protein
VIREEIGTQRRDGEEEQQPEEETGDEQVKVMSQGTKGASPSES